MDDVSFDSMLEAIDEAKKFTSGDLFYDPSENKVFFAIHYRDRSEYKLLIPDFWFNVQEFSEDAVIDDINDALYVLRQKEIE